MCSMDFLQRSAGFVVGASVGTLAYWLMLERSIHILAAVGAGAALGVAIGSRSRKFLWGVAVACLAVVVSLLVEWWFRPFAVDDSLGYFVGHVPDLPRNSLLSLAVVAVLGFYFGRGRAAKIPRPEAEA